VAVIQALMLFGHAVQGIDLSDKYCLIVDLAYMEDLTVHISYRSSVLAPRV